MEYKLSNPSTIELNVQRRLSSLVKQEIQKRNLTVKALAKQLDLLPSGAQVLMERKVWPIETSLRVAEMLRIQMDFELKFKK